MKKFLWAVGFILLLANLSYGGDIIERKTFFNRYDPSADTFVYSQTSTSSTGDQVAVNTYRQKTIQITGVSVGEDIQIRIEGRVKDQTNSPTWAILDVVNFGASSNDTAINQVIDVTEYVDFLRVGIKNFGVDGTSAIDIKGIFTNLEK